MGAFAVACAIVGISNPAWHCDEPAALACELVAKQALDMPKSFERKEVAILGPAQSRESGLRLRYEIESARGPVQGVAECFFKATPKPTCLQPNGIYDRCFTLSAVRLDGRFLSDRQIAQSATERSKANVVNINRRDSKLVWVEPEPEQKPPPSPAPRRPADSARGDAAQGARPNGLFPVYEITDRGLEHYGADHQRAERLWQIAPDAARQACAGQVKRGSDRPYDTLAGCLSKPLARE